MFLWTFGAGCSYLAKSFCLQELLFMLSLRHWRMYTETLWLIQLTDKSSQPLNVFFSGSFWELERVSPPDNAVFQAQLGQVSVPVLPPPALSSPFTFFSLAQQYSLSFFLLKMFMEIIVWHIKINQLLFRGVYFSLIAFGILLANIKALGESNFERQRAWDATVIALFSACVQFYSTGGWV